MGVDVRIRAAVPGDAKVLASVMRPADVAEVRASDDLSPIEAVEQGLYLSDEAWAVEFGTELAAVWGVTRDGCAWLLTSEIVERHPVVFWRACLAIIPELLSRWTRVYNWIDTRHEQAIRWGERLGFEFLPAAPFGAEGRPFRFFTLTLEGFQCARSQ